MVELLIDLSQNQWEVPSFQEQVQYITFFAVKQASNTLMIDVPTPPEEHPRSLLRKKGTASLRQADNARTIFFVAVGGALYA